MPSMHSSVNRLNALFGSLTTVLICLSLAIAVSSFWLTSPPTADLHITDFSVAKTRSMHRYSNLAQESAFLKFDLDADFSPLFHWNTKQVFTFLVASYNNSRHEISEATVWDHIVKDKSRAKLSVMNKKGKYLFSDLSGSFAGSNVSFALHWNIIPQVGLLTWHSNSGTPSIKFPALKV